MTAPMSALGDPRWPDPGARPARPARSRATLPALALPLLSLLAAGPSPAGDFPAEPQLRIDPGAHGAAIIRTDVDAAGRWLVSGSHDKTVRVWRLADGRLARTLRPPQGTGNLGKVYAVAISPDGETVAVGGWTGYQRWGGHSIYIFDRVSGALRHRIPGLPNVIHHLTYAPDGQRLVAALGGANGIRVYATGDYREIARDADYGDDSYWADLAADGRLVTSSRDGQIRLYGPDHRLLTQTKAPGGEEPFTVAFAPDGRHIAVGYADSTWVDVLDADDLTRVRGADTGGVDNGDLSKVAWSRDGRTLMAGGRYADGEWRPIRRWSEAGAGGFEEWRIASNTIMTLHPLADGRLAVGAAEQIALAGADGQVLWRRANPLVDLRGQRHEKGIRVSSGGERVAFGFRQWGAEPALFSVAERRLTRLPQSDPPPDGEIDPGAGPSDPDAAAPATPPAAPRATQDLAPPDEGPHPGLEVTDWVNGTTPKMNDRPLTLEPYEIARSLAIAPGDGRLVLGADWRLRAYGPDPEAGWDAPEPLWQQPVPGVVWAVNISGDGRYAIAGYGDGTLRWHRMRDGAEVLALYVQPGAAREASGGAEDRWVLWTPDGYYQASAGAEELIGWHVNRGPVEAADFFPADRFRERFYRPDVIARVLETGDPAEALRLADAERGRETAPEQTGAKAVAGLLPPTVTILSPAPGTPQTERELTLFYQVRSDHGPVTRVEARVDGRPAEIISQMRPPDADQDTNWMGQMVIRVPPEHVTVELIGYNRNGPGVAASYHAAWAGTEDFYKPDLHVLAVGISEHPAEQARLRYAAKDAQELAAGLKAQRGGLYKAVHAQTLTDADATRAGILDGLEWLERETDSRDVALVFLSGHGLRDTYDDEYFYLPYDGDLSRPARTTVTGDDIRRFLRRIQGKVILFLDTCYAGALRADFGHKDTDPFATLPDTVRFANELADAESGVIVFASSGPRQLSREDPEWQNGAFTEALLEALDGKADYTGDLHLFITELETYLAERVSELTERQQKPVTTKPKAVDNYRLLKVGGTGADPADG